MTLLYLRMSSLERNGNYLSHLSHLSHLLWLFHFYWNLSAPHLFSSQSFFRAIPIYIKHMFLEIDRRKKNER